MKIPVAEFTAGASNIENLPLPSFPEIVFAGRSNVGKSSLINTLILRKNLARISSSPGKTRQLNFYLVEKKWYLVDLPGFGFASVSKKQRQEWSDLIFSYLRSRESLKLVCALCDARHDPTEIDLGFWEWLESNERNFIVIMTKSDKISQDSVSERKEQIAYVISKCKFCHEVLPFSSVSGLGRNELFAVLKKHI